MPRSKAPERKFTEAEDQACSRVVDALIVTDEAGRQELMAQILRIGNRIPAFTERVVDGLVGALYSLGADRLAGAQASLMAFERAAFLPVGKALLQSIDPAFHARALNVLSALARELKPYFRDEVGQMLLRNAQGNKDPKIRALAKRGIEALRSPGGCSATELALVRSPRPWD